MYQCCYQVTALHHDLQRRPRTNVHVRVSCAPSTCLLVMPATCVDCSGLRVPHTASPLHAWLDHLYLGSPIPPYLGSPIPIDLFDPCLSQERECASWHGRIGLCVTSARAPSPALTHALHVLSHFVVMKVPGYEYGRLTAHILHIVGVPWGSCILCVGC